VSTSAPDRHEQWEVRFFGDEEYTTARTELRPRARLRSGALVDLAVRDAILTAYQHGAFGLVDNDLGRYEFDAAADAAWRWTIGWGLASRRSAEQWLVPAVQSHA
jgi:hypothetical protein